ncbi:MAG: hypothetical protein IH590_18500 [Aquamicrobium sp.]|nr:hypothetical protein [Aquamicrobium sp.]
MKFVLTSEHVYWWPVKVRLPDPDPKRAGKIVEQEFMMQFAAISSDEARAVMEEIAALPEAERAEREHDLMLRVARDWSGVYAQDGEVAFSPDVLKSMLGIGFYRLAIYRAYNDSMTGEAARKGN